MKINKSTRYLFVAFILLVAMIGIGTVALPTGDLRAQADPHDHAEDIHPEEAHPEPEHESHEDEERSGDMHGHEEEEEAIHEEEEEAVHMNSGQIEEFGIRIAPAGPGEIHVRTELTGEIVPAPDRVGHVVPRVQGFTREIRKNTGDTVTSGEILAVIDSRELADVKAEYLTAGKRLELARANFEREERLWERKITSEQEYLDAESALSEAGIQLYSAKQKLLSLGFDQARIDGLADQQGASLTQYHITAPLAGTVTRRNLSVGEMIGTESDIFVVSDLGQVWVNLTVYQKDLDAVSKGQKVTLSADKINAAAEGIIDYVSPVVDEETRTATARVILDNSDGKWRPGLFVTGRVDTDAVAADIVIPESAIQIIDEEPVVFVRTDHGFEPVVVETGKRNSTHVEIVSGLQPNTRIAVTNTFMLKAELNKDAIGGHNH